MLAPNIVKQEVHTSFCYVTLALLSGEITDGLKFKT